MGLRHSGHCSAPRTMAPPLVGPALGLAEGPLAGFVPPHATATRPATAETATARAKRVNRMHFLLSGAPVGVHHPLRRMSGRPQARAKRVNRMHFLLSGAPVGVHHPLRRMSGR